MMPQPADHILMTADTLGGVWTYAIELARGLADYDIQVSLATMGGHLSPEQRADVLSLPNLRVYESNFKLEWMDSPWEDVRRAGDWLLDLEERLRPDIVHLNSYAHGSLPWTTPHIVVAHSCVLSWWRAVIGGNCDHSWDAYRTAVARGLRAARSVVAPSSTMLKALYTHYSPVPAGQVIHNGRSSSLFAASAKESFILTAGRLWDKAKNVQLMQQIASDIPWPIRVAGEVREPGSRQSAHLSGLEMLGRLSAEELRIQYGKASIYAAPAKYEPFGLSILEAAFSGCPLVLGDIPSLREIWEGAAAFVHPEKPDQLRKMLIQLIRSPQLRQSLALRARRRAANFSVQRMAGSYVKLYRSLVKPGRRSNAVLKLASPRGL